MAYLTSINTILTLALAIGVFISGFSRSVDIKLQRVQYRYAAPVVCALLFSLFVIYSIFTGDTPDYYMPVGLLFAAIYLYNNREDWKHGVPAFALKSAFLIEGIAQPGRVVQRLKFQNFMVATSFVLVIGSTAIATAQGRGSPVIIYSVHAEPLVTTPNGQIDMVYSFRRTRLCTGYVNRFIVAKGSDEPVQVFESTPVGGGKIGSRQDDVRVRLKLDNLPIGNYIYRATMTHYCDDSPTPYIRRTPDVPFIVAPETTPVAPTSMQDGGKPVELRFSIA